MILFYLDRIDINQCPIGLGNPGPNKFAGTNKCKEGNYYCKCNFPMNPNICWLVGWLGGWSVG